MASVSGHVLAEVVALTDPERKIYIPSRQDWPPRGIHNQLVQPSFTESPTIRTLGPGRETQRPVQPRRGRDSAQKRQTPAGHPHTQLSILRGAVFLVGGGRALFSAAAIREGFWRR